MTDPTMPQFAGSATDRAEFEAAYLDVRRQAGFTNMATRIVRGVQLDPVPAGDILHVEFNAAVADARAAVSTLAIAAARWPAFVALPWYRRVWIAIRGKSP